MEISEAKELTTAELKERLVLERETLANLKQNHAVSPLENPMLIRLARKSIARIKTELTLRETAENNKQ